MQVPEASGGASRAGGCSGCREVPARPRCRGCRQRSRKHEPTLLSAGYCSATQPRLESGRGANGWCGRNAWIVIKFGFWPLSRLCNGNNWRVWVCCICFYKLGPLLTYVFIQIIQVPFVIPLFKCFHVIDEAFFWNCSCLSSLSCLKTYFCFEPIQNEHISFPVLLPVLLFFFQELSSHSCLVWFKTEQF